MAKQLQKNKAKNGSAEKRACFIDNLFYYRPNDGAVKTVIKADRPEQTVVDKGVTNLEGTSSV